MPYCPGAFHASSKALKRTHLLLIVERILLFAVAWFPGDATAAPLESPAEGHPDSAISNEMG